MGFGKELRRSLAVVVDLRYHGRTLQGIFDRIQVDALISEIVKHVESILSCLALLLATEHEVDPFM